MTTGVVEHQGRAVVIDGERFPCSDTWTDRAGTFYRIPLENGLFARYCHEAPEGDDPAWYPELALEWETDDEARAFPAEPDMRYAGVTEENGTLVLQSCFADSTGGLLEHPASGREVREHLVRWSQMPIVESQRLRNHCWETARRRAEAR